MRAQSRAMVIAWNAQYSRDVTIAAPASADSVATEAQRTTPVSDISTDRKYVRDCLKRAPLGF